MGTTRVTRALVANERSDQNIEIGGRTVRYARDLVFQLGEVMVTLRTDASRRLVGDVVGVWFRLPFNGG